MTTLPKRRGQYRYWNPIDSRYQFYSWPREVTAKCPRCGARIDFEAELRESYVKDEISGGYQLLDLPITGHIGGKGTCTKCACVLSGISWPEDAYYRFSVHGGDVWVWNDKYLPALRARVAGDRVTERQLCLVDGLYHYFLSRIPKHVVIKRNRDLILRKLDEFAQLGA